MMKGMRFVRGMVGAAALAVSVSASAQGTAAAIDSGDTAFIITASALVLFMTLPGLALFYGGLVRSKNFLSILMQCFYGIGN